MNAVGAYTNPLCEVVLGWAASASGHLRIRQKGACIGFSYVAEKLDYSLSRDNETFAKVTVDYRIQHTGAQTHVVFFLSEKTGRGVLAIFAG